MHRLQSFAPAIVPRVLQTYVVNLICQKVQIFQADSDYVGRINHNFFLPTDRQKLGEVQKKCL